METPPAIWQRRAGSMEKGGKEARIYAKWNGMNCAIEFEIIDMKSLISQPVRQTSSISNI